MSQDAPVRIKKQKTDNFFQLDNSIFDSGIAASIGPIAFSLYCYLTRKADKESSCWPSQKTMASVIGASDRQVRRCLAVMESIGMLQRQGRTGETKTIVLLEFNAAKVAEAAVNMAGDSDTSADPFGQDGRRGPDQPSDNQNTVEQNTGNKTQEQSSAGASPAPELRLDSSEPVLTLNQRIWFSYEQMYKSRYRVQPVRNKTVNAMISNLGHRLGEEAPAVAEFYLSHNDSFYVRSCHSVNLLLRDAEKLRTEWASGRRVTQSTARQADRKQGNLTAFEEVRARRQREAAA